MNASPSSTSPSPEAAPSLSPMPVPFKVELSLAPLIRFWSEGGDDRSAKIRAKIIQKQLEEASELLHPITDLTVIDRHRDLVDVLMGAVFAPASRDKDYGAALIPFMLRSIYATPLCQRLFVGDDGHLQGKLNLDPATLASVKVLHAYALALWRVYGIDLGLDYTIICTVTDPETGLDRHFRADFDSRFLDVEPVGEVPALASDVRERLEAHLFDVDLLARILPANRFVLRGFTIIRAVDVTDQEVLSSLEGDLIDKESIVSPTRFLGLQDKLRILFRRPELHFGLAAVEGERVLVLNSGARLEHACIFADSVHHKTSDFKGSIYARAFTEERTLVIDDLTALPGRGPIEEKILAMGGRSIIVAPLRYQGRVIGTLELTCLKPGDLNATHLPKLNSVLPLFAVAVQRSLDELHGRVQAIIKERCTAIHPTVEWRFRKAVLDTIERRSASVGEIDPNAELEPIVFANVQPLYALSDIRGSSTQRALAIQGDLIAQLRLAREVVQSAHRLKPLPALDELLYRIDKHLVQMGRSVKSGDEVGVVAFMRDQVESLFEHLGGFGATVRSKIEAYRQALDPRIGTVYDQRRRFEESVTRIAETISSYLDLEEQAAQAMYPHYFEKQKTDGVDYQIYVGPGLLEEGHWDPLSLKNLRLWQLMVTCGIAIRTDHVKEGLDLPLDVTHLILVQHAPLSIGFRFDEKRFDVDGAYDIRYEIVKKRIDKALIRGTSERATQPGKIAIIYTQPGEAQEYRSYIEYLQSLGYLTGEVEDLELDELQGVHGLRALRVTVDLHNARSERAVPLAELGGAPSGSSRN